MNKLLERQVKKYLEGVDISGLQMQEFLKNISDTYDDAENDQELINRSLDISSREMIEQNKAQQEILISNEKAIAMLKSAVMTLDPNSFLESVQHADVTQEVMRLAQFLSELIIKYKQNMHELTIQKIHAENILSELQIFRFAVENAADYIVFMDADLKVVYANIVARFGRDLSDVVGKNIDEAYSFLGITGISDSINGHIAKGDKQFKTENSFIGQYDEISIIQTITTVSNDSQNRKFFINIGRDITKDRALEREKDEFVSIASHELRTPMTVIRGYINLLNREQIGSLNDKQKDILGKMNDSTITLISFVSEMLDLSKLNAGRFVMNIVDVPIETLINNVVDKMRILFETKGVLLESNLSPAQIRTDPTQFDRIMANLLGNAYKFTPEGGIVTISNTVDDKSRLVTICITDTGVGIPALAIENLFKKFSQVDNVLQRQVSGSGLGLVICRGLVEKLGGTIWVKSKLDEGSRFFFTMPMS